MNAKNPMEDVDVGKIERRTACSAQKGCSKSSTKSSAAGLH